MYVLLLVFFLGREMGEAGPLDQDREIGGYGDGVLVIESVALSGGFNDSSSMCVD
jgi:hypothetical protein